MARTIMIVDDLASRRQIVKNALQRAARDVIQAGDGSSVLQQLIGRQPSPQQAPYVREWQYIPHGGFLSGGSKKTVIP